MFDDQTPFKTGNVPENLPVGEPADMFADLGVEQEVTTPTTPEIESTPVPTPEQPPSALAAGVMKPKTVVQTMPRDIPPSTSPTPPSPTKEPILSRYLLLIGIVVLAVGVLGGGGWFLYTSFVRDTTRSEDLFLGRDQSPTPVPVVTPSVSQTQSDSGDSITSQIKDDEVLFGRPIDSDGDGLDNVRERELSTDPNNWDTDGDELSDYDEVIWKTDPQVADSDGDGFVDGTEVKSGYNPVGPGKIFPTPVGATSS